MIATVSTAEKAELARQAGAAEVIRYTEVDDLAAAVRDLTGGAGVAAAYDGVGRETFDASLASLRPRGVLALFGAASGAVPAVDPIGSTSAVLPHPAAFMDYVLTVDDSAPAPRRCTPGRRRFTQHPHRAPLPARRARSAHEDLHPAAHREAPLLT